MITRELAQYLAQHGRHGDTELVHMSKDELDALSHGLGSLSGRRMTHNPHTGLPEMFNWSSLIPAVVGIGGTILSGGTMSPLMAGLISGAATTAATGGDWKKGLVGGLGGMAMGGVGGGLTDMGVGMGTDAAMGGAEAAGMGVAGAGAGSGAAGAGMAAGETGAMDMGAGFGADAAGSGAMGMSAAPSAAQDIAESGGTLQHAVDFAGPTAQDMAESGGTLGGSQALGESAMPQMGAANAPAVDPYEVDGAQAGSSGTAAARHDATLQEAFGGKHLYDRTLPGLVAGYGMLAGATAPKAAALPSPAAVTPNKRLRYSHEQNMDVPADASWTQRGGPPQYFKPSQYTEYAQGGMVGDDCGCAAPPMPAGAPLAQQGPLNLQPFNGQQQIPQPSQPTSSQPQSMADQWHPQAMANAWGQQDMRNLPERREYGDMAFNGHQEPQQPSSVPADSALDYNQFHNAVPYAAGGMVDGAADGIGNLPQADQMLGDTKRVRALRSHYRSKKDVVADMQRGGDSFASQLGINDPNDPLLDLAFGYTARQGKKNISMTPQFAGGGKVAGPGDGMSDSIAAHINGHRPAALSNDEYVMPADTVSHLGNGSSEAGAKTLDDMVARIRAARTGRAAQAPRINPRQVMPV